MLDKRTSNLRGNHLILFDGKKQQIIKLDAQIGLKQLDKAPSPPVASLKKETIKGPTTYDENHGFPRKGPSDLMDPQKVIQMNKAPLNSDLPVK